MTIEVRREWLAGLLAACLLAGVLALGWRASPRDAAGRPVLLLPEIRAIEHYRGQARGWLQAWRALDQRLADSLRPAVADLLAQSQAARVDLDTAQQLARSVEGAEPPATLTGLHDQAAAAAQAFAAACLAANRWLSAPAPANLAAAQAAQAQAHAALLDLEANAWVQDDALSRE